ncbi:MAG TPA: tRNA (adenosine(37)-N6)-threonylcarbamoyltransferase complex dimerization subunit type 1 TsaB, partial [Candidatus Marinimicrobia bacterium]|nr:tRNA (adenosine(37)-N6)-threonylcarbamoyltransferase complex dimerization subunit type 1 TsaB [Candidatus Neomarinimicrobiota bacterium]
ITAELFERNAIKAKDLTAIAISTGPGSFTGLRIGMAFAKGLAFAHKLPIIAIHTFAAFGKAFEKDLERFSQPMLVFRSHRDRLIGCHLPIENAEPSLLLFLESEFSHRFPQCDSFLSNDDKLRFPGLVEIHRIMSARYLCQYIHQHPLTKKTGDYAQLELTYGMEYSPKLWAKS